MMYNDDCNAGQQHYNAGHRNHDDDEDNCNNCGSMMKMMATIVFRSCDIKQQYEDAYEDGNEYEHEY